VSNSGFRIGCVALASLLTLAACGSNKPPKTISDPAFVRQANAVCAASVPQLRAPDRKATSTTTLRVATLEGTAAGLAKVAAQLRKIEVRPDDAAKVDAWLDEWDRFVTVGHRYAAAVMANDQKTLSKVDDEAVAVIERIGKFARGNGIDDCVL
jgi:hypothetical protein